MKRRTFGLLAGTSMLALAGPGRRAMAQAADFATLSKTTLTPLGSERAGNAAGTIPEWTGGFTTVPASWNPSKTAAPDFFAGDQPLYVVDSSNMAQYASLLTDGVQHMITSSGFSLKVYPSHRTHALPQYIMDNIVANSTRAQLDPAGGRLGFTGGYGGIPFPIPTISDPLAAGAQIMWNHTCRWQGYAVTFNGSSYVVNAGVVQLAGAGITQNYFPYYDPNGSLATFKGYQYMNHETLFGPATSVGTQIIDRYATNPYENPNILWELLQGQGRVRKAPELAYDTPSSFLDGVGNFDEYDGFNGALDEYDWKYIGKQEMLIPYNNNKMRNTPALVAHQAKFLNPDVVRWELHRVWVVEATLHPGSRNVLARRRFYVDEDTWFIAIADSWDANGNIYKQDVCFNQVRPDLPGTIQLNSVVYNLQSGNYVSVSGPWGNAPFNKPEIFAPIAPSNFEPQAMAAAASY
jgi:hypothetical protein